MARYSHYSEIPVWIEAHKYVILIYKTTVKFPKHEMYGLTLQIRRAALSVPSNIVEGVSRQGGLELKQFLINARASLMESDYQLMLSKDLNYITLVEYDKISLVSQSIQKQLNAWLKALRINN